MTSTYRSAGMSVEAVATRAAEKILPEGVEIFFRLLVLPLGLCFCEQSGGMTKTNCKHPKSAVFLFHNQTLIFALKKVCSV